MLSVLNSALFWLLVNNVAEALCDGSDWISVSYIVSESRQGSVSDFSVSSTGEALASIARGADQLAAKGPWSITNDRSNLPPNKNPHDYMSWAPYHWPDCRWCTKAKSQDFDDGSPGNQTDSSAQYNSADIKTTDPDALQRHYRYTPANHRRMHRVHSRARVTRRADSSPPAATIEKGPKTRESTLFSVAPVPTSHASNANQLSQTRSATQAPGEAVAKTSTKATCTPSPTTTMPPSATWTSCPYVGRDGKVNPDVRDLAGPGAINTISQYALYGSIAFATKRTAKYSQDVVNAIDTFFLQSSTKMNPNVNFGQMVRGSGPEGKKGTFTGVLDVRGIVKVINAILILKSGGSAEWTNSKDQDMRNWVSEYARWLEESDIGAITSTRPNNHVTFYTGQLAASKLYMGDKQGAINVLQRFFKNEFRDQIAASGEQPFEGIRAKPLHYRSFNLEALIMNAKLGDALGIDLWSAKSKYEATIQTALDYAITCDPNGEDVQDLVPHVAAVAAAYGDPTGRYKSFLSNAMSNYESRPLWFYNQPSAFTKSPTSGKSKRGVSFGRDDDTSEKGGRNEQPSVQGGSPVAGRPSIPFACPDAFKDTAKVEIENGMYVTCEQLRPLYETDVPKLE